MKGTELDGKITPLLGNQYSREVGDLGEMKCGLLGTQSTMK